MVVVLVLLRFQDDDDDDDAVDSSGSREYIGGPSGINGSGAIGGGSDRGNDCLFILDIDE